ncbi:MAG: AsmA family protein [Terriglobia bacterium]
MSRRRKAALVAACIVVAFLLAVLVIAPRIFQVDRYRPYVISMIEQRTGRQVAMGHLGLTVFPSVTIHVDDLTIANPSGFPAGDWLRVKRVNARLDLGALWHHHIVIRSLDLSQPVLRLRSDAQGHWNYQLRPPRLHSGNAPGANGRSGAAAGALGRLAASRSAPPVVPAHLPVRAGASDPPLFSLQEISAVSLKDGHLTVASVLAGGDAGSPSVEAEGIAGDFKNIDFAAAGAPLSGAALPASASGRLSVKTLHAENVQATNLVALVQALPTQVRLNDVKFDFYSGRGQCSVLLDLARPSLQYSAQGNLKGVNAAQLVAGFARLRGQLTGTIESQFALSGASTRSADAFAGMQGHGTLTIRKGRLPALRLDKTLLQLAHVAEIKAASGDPSAFSLIAVEWQLDHSLITTRSVRMVGNGITVDGSGTIELAAPGRLNYQGVAKIAAMVNPLTNILANLSGAAFANGQLSLPFKVEGTLQNPVFRLKQNFNRGLASPMGNPNQPPQAIQNILKLFQRKK